MKQCSILVSKEVTFDCAHMLTGHNALCKNLHGHTYKVQISVIGTSIPTGSSACMVLDFKHLKEAINKIITSQFDYAVIFSSIDFRGPAENALYAWAVENGMRHVVMPSRTTAENMASYFKMAIFNYLVEELDLQNVTDVIARVYETPTSYAEV